MGKKKGETFYRLSVEDIQEVAKQELDRELTPEEVKLVADRVGDYISWYDVITFTINEKIVSASK